MAAIDIRSIQVFFPVGCPGRGIDGLWVERDGGGDNRSAVALPLDRLSHRQAQGIATCDDVDEEVWKEVLSLSVQSPGAYKADDRLSYAPTDNEDSLSK
jgi:hypothetical protein